MFSITNKEQWLLKLKQGFFVSSVRRQCNNLIFCTYPISFKTSFFNENTNAPIRKITYASQKGSTLQKKVAKRLQKRFQNHTQSNMQIKSSV